MPTLGFFIQYGIIPNGHWSIADTTPGTKTTRAGQPKGKSLQYRVFARNKAGDGLPGNVRSGVVIGVGWVSAPSKPSETRKCWVAEKMATQPTQLEFLRDA